MRVAVRTPKDDGVAVSDVGRPKWLCGAWRTDSLRAAVAGDSVAGARLGEVLGSLDPALLEDGGLWPRPWTDVDTPQVLTRAREYQ